MDYTRFHKRKFRITVFPKKEFYSLEKLLKLLYKRKFQLLDFLKRKFLSEKFQKLPKSGYIKFHKRKFQITVFPKKEFYLLEKLLKLLYKRKFWLLNFLKRKFCPE